MEKEKSDYELDLKRMNEEVIKQIEVFKWLESEKAGKDIGENEAANRWVTERYQEWYTHNVWRFLKKKGE